VPALTYAHEKVGVVVFVLTHVIPGPKAGMQGGAIRSGLAGWLLSDDADQRAEGQPA
jgi:hypothetical protein